MTISKYLGERLLPLELTAASQLEKNRVVKVTSGVPAYPTYGDIADGGTRIRGDANDYEITVMPFDFLDKTFHIDIAGTVTAHAALFATGAVGKVKAATGTVQSRKATIPANAAGNDGLKWIVPAGTAVLAAWNGTIEPDTTAGAVATYTHSGTSWAAVAPTAGDIYLVADEGIYVIFNGTTWVETPILCHAAEAGVDGNTILAYNKRIQPIISAEHIDSGIRSKYVIKCAGQITVASGETSGTFLHDDIVAGDIALATNGSNSTAALTEAIEAVCTTDTVTVTITDPSTSGATINVVVIGAVS